MELENGYSGAVEHAAFFVHPAPGYFRLSGPDRRAYLQRQTTNDITQLRPGRVLVTVLTSPAARILDVFTLIEQGDLIGILTLPGQGEGTFRFLRSRIFFNDKVALEDTSLEFSLVDVIGPMAPRFLESLGQIQDLQGDDLLVQHLGDQELRVWQLPELGLRPTLRSGLRLLVPTQQLSRLRTSLRDFKSVKLSAEAYDLLRIEAGIPASAHELTEEYTPLETGLGAAISHTKGCYTGQEVIARQITYDKVTRQMVGLKLDVETRVGEDLRQIDTRQAIGKITSATLSPRFGPIALGVVRKPYDQPGSQLLIGDALGGHPGLVIALPF